jgi:two-component system alkaline phosphatase synthesis response regulator PhoP
MTRRSILLAEDEPGLRRTLTDLLENRGYAVTSAPDGAEAERLVQKTPFDLIILDVMLPSRNGFEVCRTVRKLGIQSPILMLTARSELNNKVQGFKAGADDYLTKPFEPVELHMRIEALLRRAPADARRKLKSYKFQNVSVDFVRASLNKDGKIIPLSERETRLLQHLIESGGTVVSRDELLQEVWGYQSAPMTRTVDVHIAWLRQKVEEDPANPKFILTVHGQGYRFAVE